MIVTATGGSQGPEWGGYQCSDGRHSLNELGKRLASLRNQFEGKETRVVEEDRLSDSTNS